MEVFAKCGMRCDLCLIYRPNVEREDRRADACKKRVSGSSRVSSKSKRIV